MAESARLGLPYLAGAQTQKHVTVNAGLSRLDALVQMVAEGEAATPPGAAADGAVWIVGEGAGGDWAGWDGMLALWSNGGWEQLVPGTGWSAWDLQAGLLRRYDGTGWIAGAVALAPDGSGAATVSRVLSISHAIGAGAVSTVAAAIPAGALVTGVTARVTGEITGSGVASWSLGVAGSADRYGAGMGLGAGSWARGLTGSPLAYYAETDMEISADAGSFSGGSVLLALHLTELLPPRAV
ncbi:DUF2793 domain-containing protein [Oceanomicrobium pacificus]|uniref:DUF2793 domain-containing protein n=1 Tax=Oceanomicrobium pacificus TaxID=2692916 RepID=A0A6B0TQW1_9RHOB|nr:DUF2793 domain-containing protein [Oceanomicrobium pacificus]MXU66326.1 DUF2793 domain-containing protein [Oceanomicrobium pacificus]